MINKPKERCASTNRHMKFVLICPTKKCLHMELKSDIIDFRNVKRLMPKHKPYNYIMDSF